MKIVLFSTNANHFEPSKFLTKTFPSRAEQLSNLAKRFCEHTFFVVAEPPAPFLLDIDENGEISKKAKEIQYEILNEKHSSSEEVAGKIKELKPDVAIAASAWADPFDWISIKDGIVSEILASKGVRVLANPSSSAMKCFDKWQTKQLLFELKIPTAKTVFVHHWLFWCAQAKGGVRENVYREFVLKNIENLHYPVVIKDTVGLSSFGMVVAKTFGEARDFLLSRKNSSDRIVEEYVEGRQFGVEIHGTAEKYTVFPPMEFSVTKHGITSPKQNVKFLQKADDSIPMEKLEKNMVQIAKSLSFSGIAQVDLVLSNGEWFVLEINPRLSGMTTSYAVSVGKNPIEMLVDAFFGKTDFSKMQSVLNFKLPPVDDEKLKKIFEMDGVLFASEIENKFAVQKRGVGYAQLILDGEKAIETLEKIKKSNPELIEETFLKNAISLIKGNS